ncbi:undecaprenyl-diphosphate phosphatase, partial [Pseudomonas aeruginosa]
LFRPEDLPVFAVGFVTSFVFAMLAVRALLKFIGNHSYAAFAWYRIAFGLLILVLLFRPTGILGRPEVEKV